MTAARASGAGRRNTLVERREAGRSSNLAWLRALPAALRRPGAVVLLGGSGIVDFRLRVAQSHLRGDLLPSFWSQAGILASPGELLTVPMDDGLVPQRVPRDNAIHSCPLAAYDDPVRYPNVAVVQFAADPEGIVEFARRLRLQRSAVDLPTLLARWLAFAWGAGESGNPLLAGEGVPSAALVESAYAMGGLELAPGVASAASSPEAIWQSAIWWHEYYERSTGGAAPARRRSAMASPDARPRATVPSGAFVTRQEAAAVVEDGDGSPRDASGRRARAAAPGAVR